MNQNMDVYFLDKIEFGKYFGKTIRYVFSNDRQYFDQIIYKNKGFRLHYITAYAEWLNQFDAAMSTPKQILVNRINEGIRQIGEDRVRFLFADVLDYINRQSERTLPRDTDYKRTLPDMDIDIDSLWQTHMNIIRRFWQRLAIPNIMEEQL